MHISFIKNKLHCSPSEPTKAHITAKEFVIFHYDFRSYAGKSRIFYSCLDGKDKHFRRKRQHLFKCWEKNLAITAAKVVQRHAKAWYIIDYFLDQDENTSAKKFSMYWAKDSAEGWMRYLASATRLVMRALWKALSGIR